MTALPSIGDLSRSFHTRMSNALLKSRLDRLTQEVTTGVKSDLAQHLRGDLSISSGIESRLTMLTTYRRNAAEAEARFDGMQTAMESLQSVAVKLGPDLLSEVATAPREQLLTRSAQGKDYLSAIVTALNTSVAGKSIFNGTRTDLSPLPPAREILTQAAALTAGQPTIGDITSIIDQWFDAPVGSGGFVDTIYRGNNSNDNQLPIDDGISVGSTLTANSSAFKGLMKGAILAALATDPSRNFNVEEIRGLLSVAGESIIDANANLTLERSKLGFTEETVAKNRVRNEAETSALSISLSKLIAADPYETSVELKEVEAGLQNLYALTARLSKLSLTDYLR